VKTTSAAVWQNWAGTARCRPSRILRPSGDEEIAETIGAAARAEKRVRVAGSGHSFNDIACTDEVLLSLDRHDRILEVDREARTVTVQAGITLGRLSEQLASHGLALSNLGDVGYQTLAGALATATHGTGARFGNLSTQVRSIRLVLANSSVVECSPGSDPDGFRAAQASLGALGVFSAVTLQCEQAFNLHTVEEPARVEDVLASFEQRIEENEHFEFFWFPHTNRVLTKANNRTDRPPSPKNRGRAYVDEILLANRVFGLFCRAGRRWPPATPRLARLVGGLLSRSEEVDRSDRVFTSPRLVRFAEMEYAIPRASMADAFREVRTLIQRSGFRVSFPVEVRAVAADDIPLSPSFGRVTAYIAVHMFQGVEYEPYFRGVEAIMQGMGGRPHWGKLHFRTAETLRPAYPEWDRFAAVRGRLDPERRFANDYLDRVLGP
jgi:L-gulonolactone oxidase